MRKMNEEGKTMSDQKIIMWKRCKWFLGDCYNFKLWNSLYKRPCVGEEVCKAYTPVFQSFMIGLDGSMREIDMEETQKIYKEKGN